MALTLQTQREMFGDRFVKGMRVVTITFALGATSDYSTVAGSEGLDMQSIRVPLGFGTIADIWSATWKQADGTMRIITSLFNSETNRLRGFKVAAGATAEVVPATDLAAGDLIQLTVFGG